MEKKPLKNFPPDDEIKIMFRRARRYMLQFGYPAYLADDFAQFYLLKVCEGRKANMDKLLVDFLRYEFGDVRNPYGLMKSKSRLKMVHEVPIDWVKSNDFYFEKKMTIPEDQFSAKERWILERIDEGYAQREIGDFMGVSESRVSQILRCLKKKERKRNERGKS